jgi:hypothetical protein
MKQQNNIFEFCALYICDKQGKAIFIEHLKRMKKTTIKTKQLAVGSSSVF